MKEYTDRGVELEGLSYLDFFLNTYDGYPCPSTQHVKEMRGQKPSERVPYMEESGRGTKCRVIRKDGHEMMPEFIGEWFPRNDDLDSHKLYCAWMLAFFVLWRSMRDICPETQMFQERFKSFEAVASDQIKTILKDIQYYWECIDSAKKHKQEGGDKRNYVIDVEEMPFDEDEGDEVEEVTEPVHEFTQHDVEVALANEYSQEQRLYASVGMIIADEVGIFKPKEGVGKRSTERYATREDAYWTSWMRQVADEIE